MAATMQDDGVEYKQAKHFGGGGRAGSTKTDICHKFNSLMEC